MRFFIKTLIIVLAITTLVIKPLPAFATYNGSDPDNKGTNKTFQVADIKDFETVFASIVTAVGALMGFTFFAMMIWGGIKYLLSGGDPKAVAAAKGTITWAIIGLAVFALSYTILLLIKAFTGVDVTIFKVV